VSTPSRRETQPRSCSQTAGPSSTPSPGAEASESEPEIEPDIEPDPDPDPDASANGIPAPEKPLAEMKLPELIAYAEQIGIPAEQIDPFRKPGKSKAAAIELINAHIAAQPAE
jgi:hypothetical protein